MATTLAITKPIAILNSVNKPVMAAGREHTNLKNEQPGQNTIYSYKYHSHLEVKLSAIYSPIGCFVIESHFVT
ncbi:MAG: hypothetical protein ACRDBQ_16160 [Shewanella sp.]